MMKQLLSLALCATLAPTAAACAEESRVLVAYFSRAGENYSVGVIEKGNTEILAGLIAEETGAELFAITPAKPYPENYDETLTRATEEAEADARPEMAQTLENLDAYDVIFVGYPIWWGGVPMILHTFFESVDFTGKTVIPFNTHEGSGQGGTVTQLRAALPNATVLDGFAVRGATAQQDAKAARKAVTDYLATIELPSSSK